jgi:hypothetical protein
MAGTFDEVVAIKWALSQLKKKMKESPDGAIKMPIGTNKVVVRYTEMQVAFERLIEGAEKDRLRTVHFCHECGAYTGGDRLSKGCCFPQGFTSGRNGNDYCSCFYPKGRK